MKDLGRDEQSKRVREQETSMAREGLAPDRHSTVDQKGEMGNKGSKEGAQKIKAQDKIPSRSPWGRC
jgi:hypothetical protein